MREMKDSGVPWIGEIPKEWKLLRNKNAFICSKDIVGKKSSSTQLLSLTTKGIKEKGPDIVGGKVPDTYDTYQSVRKGQLVMCLFDLDCSAVFSGLSPFDGMISPAYKVLDCKAGMDPSFASYWFSSVFDGRKFMHYSKNLRYTLTYDEFAVLPIIIPTSLEQQRIADFLDAKCAEIDSVLEKTKASIEEYKKLKQSVITEAVTKGVRGKRPMKDSGVKWIGEIPTEWEMSTLGRISSSVRNGYVGPTRDLFVEDGIRYIQSLHIKEGMIDFSRQEYYVPHEWASKRPKIKANNLLIVQTGDIGQVALVTDEYDGCNCHALIIVDINENMVFPLYLTYYLRSHVGKELLLQTKTGALLPHLNSGRVVFTEVCLPTIAEQLEIAAYLDEKCAAIDSLISSKEALVAELETYKKSLIYEYVTGKKEVPTV